MTDGISWLSWLLHEESSTASASGSSGADASAMTGIDRAVFHARMNNLANGSECPFVNRTSHVALSAVSSSLKAIVPTSLVHENLDPTAHTATQYNSVRKKYCANHVLDTLLFVWRDAHWLLELRVQDRVQRDLNILRGVPRLQQECGAGHNHLPSGCYRFPASLQRPIGCCVNDAALCGDVREWNVRSPAERPQPRGRSQVRPVRRARHAAA
jgi:hypothetical protein